MKMILRISIGLVATAIFLLIFQNNKNFDQKGESSQERKSNRVVYDARFEHSIIAQPRVKASDFSPKLLDEIKYLFEFERTPEQLRRMNLLFEKWGKQDPDSAISFLYERMNKDYDMAESLIVKVFKGMGRART